VAIALPAGANTRSTGVAAAAGPSVHMTMTADAPSVSAGTPIGFTLTISNTGTAPANDLSLTDPLAGPSSSIQGWSIDATAPGTTPTAFALTNSHGSVGLILSGQLLGQPNVILAAGQTLSVHIVAPTTVAGCGTFTNSASLFGATASASASETVLCP
jgi:uncharacterized repeat protein (TIGR01451 family)